MPKRITVEIKLAAREWKRQFYTAVVRSFAKTVTEPETNTDTSYKRKLGLPDSNGLVAAALGLAKGTKFDLSKAKEALRNSKLEREIQIHVYTAKGYGRPARTLEIVDYAEGMTLDELKAAFEEFAADKTTVSKGRPGRSLFGRGVTDVLLGHQHGTFYSYKNGILSKMEFRFDPAVDEMPKAIGEVLGKPSAAVLRELHLKPGENGSCVRVVLAEDLRIPEWGSLGATLSQFYMLRLIHADPNIKVRLFRYRAFKKVTEELLGYDFPIGDVIERVSFPIDTPVPGAPVPTLEVEGIVCRANVKGSLPGLEAREQRANGLLIVDDTDAVLDLTLLPEYERAPYLANVFGIVRIKNMRQAIEWFLNNGKDSPLTTTRDGFDTKHELTKRLFAELERRLAPVYRREEERFNKGFETVPTAVRQRISDALKELNRLLREVAGEGDDGTADGALDPAIPLQFLPRQTRLFVGKPRRVRLFFQKTFAGKSGAILYETSNPKISFKPLSENVAGGRTLGEHLVYDLSLECSDLHETGKVVALAEGKEGTYDANVEILDVVAGAAMVPPEEMEFRPQEAHGQPNRVNTVGLLVNATAIPPGRKITLRMLKSQGAIGLVEASKKTSSLEVVFDKSHLISGTQIGRIPISWQGTAWGQSAALEARTKKPGGGEVVAEGRIVLEEPDDSGGMVRDVQYRDLNNDKCSDLVDGIIYINSRHHLNRFVFGPTQKEYLERIGEDPTAQYRFASLVLEQAVYRLAEEQHRENRLVLAGSPVTDLRKFVDEHTQKFAPKLLRSFVTRKIGG
jgi:hypothetical protein